MPSFRVLVSPFPFANAISNNGYPYQLPGTNIMITNLIYRNKIALRTISLLHNEKCIAHLLRRGYRGESSDAESNLSAKEQELLKVALPRSEAVLERHVRFPKLSEIPKASLGPHEIDADLELDVRRKRLVYRAKQRGWLEVDLLLGTWANENVSRLSASELDEFEAFVNMETIDIYNIVTLRMDIPEDLKTASGDGIVERIQAWARNHPLGKADPETYKAVKSSNNLI